MSKISLDPKIEEQYVRNAQKDPKDFAPLYTHYYPHIKKYVQKKLNAEVGVIEDITERVFEKALKNIKKFEWRGYSFSSWLYRIASTTVPAHFREIGKSKVHTGIEEEVEVKSSSDDSPEKIFETEYADQLLGELLQELPDRERQIIYLKFFEGYSNRVIADRVGISESNVGTIVHRCLLKMRESFQSM